MLFEEEKKLVQLLVEPKSSPKHFIEREKEMHIYFLMKRSEELQETTNRNYI